MGATPDISIITVTYNGFQDTCELIESVQQYLGSSCELIVVDNASVRDEASLISKKYPWVITVRNKANLGFSGGNNAGIKASKGKYLFFLNNDTIIKDNSVLRLAERLNSNPLIGAVSPKIKFAFPPENIQYAGYTPLSCITLRNQTIGFGEEDNGQYDIACPVAYLHGAAMMVKRELISKAGLMPEIYFLYYEELDWSTRMRQAGYVLFYDPHCTIFHKESQSTGQTSALRTFYLTRNRLLYAYRNLNGIVRLSSLLYQISIALPKNVLSFLLQGRADLAKASLRGVYKFCTLKEKKN